MTRSARGAALLALVAATSAPASPAASASPVAAAASPIHVTRCSVVPQAVPRHGTAQESIRISFSIDGDIAADEARFVVASGPNRLKGFVARGTFSRGVIIADRLLEATPSVSEFDAVRGGIGCFATYVHFVDGASWKLSSADAADAAPAATP